MTKTKTTKPRVVEPFWKDEVYCYLMFMKDKFSGNPRLEGSAPRDLKSIVRFLREQAEAKGILWTKDIACRSLTMFLIFAWRDERIIRAEQWLMPYANKFKNEIYEIIHDYKLSKNKP